MLNIIILIVFTILCLAGICADIAIIYTLFCFKRLRSPFNIFLANWAISDLLCLILIPINYAFVIVGHGTSREVDCIFMQAELILHVTEILFGIVLCIDWCLAAHYQRLSEKFRKYYRNVVTSVWILSLLFYCIATGLCISSVSYPFSIILFGIFYAISLIFVITLQFTKIAQKFRRLPIGYSKQLTLRLTLITVIIISYLLAVISMLMMFLEIFYYILTYFVISAILSACAVFSSSVITLLLLCWLNYDFRQCLFQLRKPIHERFDNDVSETEDGMKIPPEMSVQASSQDVETNGYTDLVS